VKRALLAAAILLTAGAAAVVVAYRTMPDAAQACQDLPHGPEARACYAAQLEPNTPDGLPAMFTAATAMLTDPASAEHFTLECHEVMHDLGTRFETAHPGRTLSDLPGDWCANGFQHGLLEVRLGKVPNDRLRSAGSELCAGEDPAICLHILGHVAARRGLDTGTFADAETLAAAVCAPETTYADRAEALTAFRCLDGAYMEWTLWVLRVDNAAQQQAPLEHCLGLRQTSKIRSSACLSQVGALLYESAPDVPAAFDACNALQNRVSPQAAELCVASLGAAIVGFVDDPVVSARELCPAGDVACVAGFARAYGETVGGDAATDLCAAVLPEQAPVCADRATGPYPFEY
jgi:hypothetical protein